MKKKEKLQSKKVIIWLIAAIAICGVLVTYAALQYAKRGKETNQLTTGTLILELDDGAADGITIDPAIPKEDVDGLKTTSYTFVLRNTGTTAAEYRISLIDDEEAYLEDHCSDNRMPHSALKTAITKDSGDENISLLDENDDYLDTGELKPKGEITYTLKLWIDQSAENDIEGTHFHGKIKLEGIVKGRKNFETGE